MSKYETLGRIVEDVVTDMTEAALAKSQGLPTTWFERKYGFEGALKYLMGQIDTYTDPAYGTHDAAAPQPNQDRRQRDERAKIRSEPFGLSW